ncbi:T9SS type A sorting domain-containing protein [Chitinophaga lutea]
MIRSCLLAILILFSLHPAANAQTDPLRTKLDDVFSAINKSVIHTGFLEEFGMPYIPLDVFGGVLTDSNKVSMDAWRMAYATLYSSRINGTNPLPALTTVNTTIATEESAGAAIPVPLLYAEYNYLRYDALSTNLLTISAERYYDVAGRPKLPYNTSPLFLASPSRNYTRNGQVTLVFKSPLFYNTTTRTSGSLQVDFDNGAGYQPVAWNTPLSCSYTANGTKRLKIRLNFTDGGFSECYSPLEVTGVGGLDRYAQAFDVSQLFQNFSTYKAGYAYVRYSRKDATRKLDKPLIFVEGFDISTIAGRLQGNYTFRNLVSELETLQLNSFNFDLSDSLDRAGYDLVFVDFGDGAHDIKMNALLLKEVINWVNAQKAAAGSITPNVVLGVSMGGLVARYCLADMTKAGQNPQTRLLITHDSPHRGANVPVGIQLLVQAAAEMPVGIPGLKLRHINKELDAATNVLNAPAAGQMLITKANLSYNAFGAASYSYSPNTFLDNEYRPMVTFPPTGVQPAYKTVAVALGSECGNPVTAPGSSLVSMQADFNKELVPWIFRRGSRIVATANAVAASYASGQVMSFRHIWAYKILGIQINVTRAQVTANASMLSWDGAPGGIYGGALVSGLPNAQFDFAKYLHFGLGTNLQNDFCFVPVVSALDIENISSTSIATRYNGGFSPGNPSRMDDFIATDNTGNRLHAFFQDENARWIWNQIDGDGNSNLNRNQTCPPNQGFIEGDFPAPGCAGAVTTFKVRGFPATGATYTWSTAGGLTFTGQGQPQITATRTSSVATTISVTVQVRGYTFTYTKQIPVASVELGGYVYYSDHSGQAHHNPMAQVNEVCTPGEVSMVFYPNSAIISVTQTNPGFPSTGWWFDSGGVSVMSWYVENNAWPTFEVTYDMGCGVTTRSYQLWENCPSPFSISPNPASGQLTIKTTPVAAAQSAGARMAQASAANVSKRLIHQVVLVDMSGRELQRKVVAPASAYTLDISRIPAGMYLLRIFDGKDWSVEKVIVR